MDFWQIIMTPFSWLLKTFCEVFDSYAIALVLFTLVVKIILFPFQLKGKKSMIKMTMVSGQLQEIQKRCGNDRERYNQEVQKFYADNNISPMSGCGWQLIPILILWPLYAIIRRPMKYLMGLTENATTAVATALGWTDFATATGTYNELTLASMLNAGNLETAKTAAAATGVTATGMFVINFKFLGLDLTSIPTWRFWEDGVSWASVGLFLLPIISAALSLLSMLVSQKTNIMNKEQQQNKTPSSWMMMAMSPLISLWIGYSMPASMCIYWISNSVLMMIQEAICGKILKKDYIAAQKAMEEQAIKQKEEEKERRRIAAEKKAAALAASKSGKLKKVQPQAKNKGVDLSASREGIRAYARGRAYDPNRYPITPYSDPDGKYKKKEEEPEPLTEEEKAILMENGVPIPEEDTAPVEAAEEERAAAEETPVQEEAPREEEDGYEAPYEEEEPKE